MQQCAYRHPRHHIMHAGIFLALLWCLPVAASGQARLDSLRQALEERVQQDQTDWLSRVRLADVYGSIQRYEDAVPLLEQAAALAPDSAFVHMRLGDVLFAGKQMDRAIAAYRRAIALQPPNASDAYQSVCNCLVELGRLEEALTAIDQALALQKDHVGYMGTKALVLLSMERFDESQALYERALSLNPTIIDAYNQRARALVPLERYDTAARVLKQVLTMNPLVLNARYGLGIVLILQNKLDEAEQQFRLLAGMNAESSSIYYIEHMNHLDWDLITISQEQLQAALTGHPGLRSAYADAYKVMAISYFTHGTRNGQLPLIQRAESIFTELKTIAPDDAEVYNHLGYTYYVQERYDAAELEFRGAMKVQPDFADASNNLGLVLKQTGRFDEAEAAYRAALTTNPEFFAAFGNLGILYLDQKKPEQAAGAFSEALAIKPDYLEAYDGLASAYFMQRKLDEGIDILKKAAYVDPQRDMTYLQLGEALLSKNELSEARQAFRMAFSINPRLEDAYIGMGMSYLRERKAEEAIVSFGMAVQVNPRSTNPRLAQAYKGIGGIYFENGNWRQAEIFLHRSFFFDKELSEVHYMLGTLYAATGREKEARAEFEAESKIPGGVPQASRQLEVMDRKIAENANQAAAGKFRLRHILVASQADADTVLNELKRGVDFLYVAQQRSKDPSASRGGDTGFLNRGDLSPELEQAVQPLKIGEYTKQPVQSPQGYHLFKRIE